MKISTPVNVATRTGEDMRVRVNFPEGERRGLRQPVIIRSDDA